MVPQYLPAATPGANIPASTIGPSAANPQQASMGMPDQAQQKLINALMLAKMRQGQLGTAQSRGMGTGMSDMMTNPGANPMMQPGAPMVA